MSEQATPSNEADELLPDEARIERVLRSQGKSQRYIDKLCEQHPEWAEKLLAMCNETGCLVDDVRARFDAWWLEFTDKVLKAVVDDGE